MLTEARRPAAAEPMPRRRTMFWRALRRRCPACGAGPIFTRWLQMLDRCPSCGLGTTRGEAGYFLGAIWFNLLAAEAFTTGLFIATVIVTWPDVPWGTLQVTAPLEALVMPVLFFPISKGLFLAFDLSFRPPTAKDFDPAR
jgi:uncharacterized protein (DUF983 family)